MILKWCVELKAYRMPVMVIHRGYTPLMTYQWYHSTDSRCCGIITFQTSVLTYWWIASVKHIRPVCWFLELKTANTVMFIYK